MGMKNFVVEPSFWELFPKGQINVAVFTNVDNHDSALAPEVREGLLTTASQVAQKFLTAEKFAQNQVVQEWRQAYQQFKKKKGARSSIEALLKRVDQGRTFDPISPLVDIYNSISLTYGVPCGMEDCAKVDGTMKLGLAQGGESFWPLGAEKDDPARTGELIYSDDTGAICRSLNWREGARTMLTDESTKVIAFMESVNEAQAQRADQAMTELVQKMEHVMGATVLQTATITPEQQAPVTLD